MSEGTQRIAAIHFDTKTVDKRHGAIEHERAVAIYDLLAQNFFSPVGHELGPYEVHLGVADNRLMLDIRHVEGRPITIFGLSITPFRRVIRDYAMICDSYYAAIGIQSLTQVEAIDMGRRAVHDEGAELLMQRLEGKVEIDHNTARRLFTLIYVLQTSGASAAPAAPVPRVLFVCTRNAVRSPMAEGLLTKRRGSGRRVASAGVAGDSLDPMTVAVLNEVGIDFSHQGHTLAEAALTEFDVIVALSPEAAAAVTAPPGVAFEYWEIEDPTLEEGNREVRLDAYRRVRGELERRIAHRFPA